MFANFDWELAAGIITKAEKEFTLPQTIFAPEF